MTWALAIRPRRVKEGFEDVDEKLQLRRKARNTLLDVRRQLPQVCVHQHVSCADRLVTSTWLRQIISDMLLLLAVAAAVWCLLQDTAWTDFSDCSACLVLS